MEPEFADRDHLVLMLTPELGEDALTRVADALCQLPRLESITEQAPTFAAPRQAMSIREAMLSPAEVVSVEESIGRILAVPSVGCPPAVPILVCGEVIDDHAAACFRYYGIDRCWVVKRGVK